MEDSHFSLIVHCLVGVVVREMDDSVVGGMLNLCVGVLDDTCWGMDDSLLHPRQC